MEHWAASRCHAEEETMSADTARPAILILTSEALFPQFFPDPLLRRLARAGRWKLSTENQDNPRLRQEISESDVLLTTWHSPFLTLEMLGERPRTRLIAHCGGEIRARMEEAVVESLTVTNAPGPMAAPVAEMALALVLTMVRRIPEYSKTMRDGLTQDNRVAVAGETLRGRTVGLVGFGRIGQAFARLVRPFGVRLLVSDPYCDRAIMRRLGATGGALDDILPQASVLVLAAGVTAETRGLLDARRIGLLPPDACLVNVGRGALVELPALMQALREQRIRAALDVTDPLEPLPPDHELRRVPGLILTPHIAAGGLEVRSAMGEVAVGEAIRFLKGQPVRNRVTRAMMALMT